MGAGLSVSTDAAAPGATVAGADVALHRRVPGDGHAFGHDALAVEPLRLDDREFGDMLHALRFRHFKWDVFGGGNCLISRDTIVLSRRAHEEVVCTVEAIDRALRRLESRVRGDRDALRRMAIPDALHGIIAEEREETLQIARYDLFPCDDGRWMVSEFNEDVPGGYNEAVIPSLVGDPGDGLSWEGDLVREFKAAFRGYDRVALLYATGYREDLQHMLILEKWLLEEGHHTVLASPDHLHSRWRRPHVLGQRIDAAFRFYPAEWLPKLPDLTAWRRLGPDLPMMNPLHRLVRQRKTMFAPWRETADDADRALIDRHCPRTLPFADADVACIRDERERWVIKCAFGRMGDGVVIGALVTPKEWDVAIAEAMRAPAEFCVQERFVATPLQFRAGPMYPAIGAFIVNGRFAGYYSRAAPRPLTTHEAAHVATLVRSA
jgi:glutathionylspermidine synthase